MYSANACGPVQTTTHLFVTSSSWWMVSIWHQGLQEIFWEEHLKIPEWSRRPSLRWSFMQLWCQWPASNAEMAHWTNISAKRSVISAIVLFFVCWPLKDRAAYVLVAGYPCMHGEKAAAPAQYCPRSLHIYVEMIYMLPLLWIAVTTPRISYSSNCSFRSWTGN